MGITAIEENRKLFAGRAHALATMVDGFNVEEHGDSTELRVDLPTNTFNQIMLGPETLKGGADAIKALLPKGREYALWSWTNRINGIGDITELDAMMLRPDPWAEDPKIGDCKLILADKPEHFRVAGEVIARTMTAGEGAVIRKVFSDMKKQPADAPNKLKRLLLTKDSRCVATVATYSEGETGMIFDFAVQPSDQGQGHGKTLLNVIIRDFMNSGQWRIHLQSVSSAVSLYESAGFKKIGNVFETIGNRRKPAEPAKPAQEKASEPA